MKGIWDAFTAFHVNGFNHFICMLTDNWAFLLLATAALASIVMLLKAQIDLNVYEEQQIL